MNQLHNTWGVKISSNCAMNWENQEKSKDETIENTVKKTKQNIGSGSWTVLIKRQIMQFQKFCDWNNTYIRFYKVFLKLQSWIYFLISINSNKLWLAVKNVNAESKGWQLTKNQSKRETVKQFIVLMVYLLIAPICN